MNNEQLKYQRAKKRVESIKGFYSHLSTYIVINIIIIVVRLELHKFIVGSNPPDDFVLWMDLNVYSVAIFWGIGLLIHGLYVFGPTFGFLRKWEERKIQEFLDKDNY